VEYLFLVIEREWDRCAYAWRRAYAIFTDFYVISFPEVWTSRNALFEPEANLNAIKLKEKT
jgi:hypothetical protein